VGLERGPLSLVSTIEVVLEIKSSGSDLESVTPTMWHSISANVGGGRLVGIVNLRA
jgi:hypothetical protein